MVLIAQVDAAGKRTSLGSGFIVSSSGVIVTNNHVIAPDEGAVKLTIKLPRGDVYTDVRIIYTETRRDFAVLFIKATGLPTLKVGDSDLVEVGDQVVAIGNPKGLELTFTSGIVGSVRLDPSNGYRFIQHQAPISPGSSGGPLLNLKGEVIGINTFTFKDAQNLNGAIPINYVRPYFGDAPGATWEKYAKVSAVVPPVQTPAATPAQPPSQPPAASGSAPGTVFGTLSYYRPQGEDFRNGFAAGVFDMVALFAAVADGSGRIDNQEVLTLFRCIDAKGDQLPELRTWMDSMVSQLSAESSIVVELVAKACHTSLSPGKYQFFEHSIDNYKKSSDTYKNGFAAGVYDVISLYAAATNESAVSNQKALALFRCLDGKGDKVDELRTWVDSTVTQASPETHSVILAVVGMCKL